MLQIHERVIHIDPYEIKVDYINFPKADLVLITHEHGDHYDQKALEKIAISSTFFIAPQAVVDAGLRQAHIMKNGDTFLWNEIKIEAVPAYNILHMRFENVPFHPKGIANGYILNF